MNNDIESEIKAILSEAPPDPVSKLDYLSRYFLGCPYVLGPQGEGNAATFDQYPLFRLDAFDCLTYVANVVALFNADTAADVVNNYIKMNYYDDTVELSKRFHFTSFDWNQQNNRHGFICDITSNFSVSTAVSAVIDKRNWFKHCGRNMIRLHADVTEEQRDTLYNDLMKQTMHFLPQEVSIDYLPLDAFFMGSGAPNSELFAQLPNGAILEIVRPAWDLTSKIGTRLHVSHLGFIFREGETLMFRHASTDFGCVVTVSLIDYLDSCRDNQTIGGVNVQIVL